VTKVERAIDPEREIERGGERERGREKGFNGPTPKYVIERFLLFLFINLSPYISFYSSNTVF
jgi:hypothetical protein